MAWLPAFVLDAATPPTAIAELFGSGSLLLNNANVTLDMTVRPSTEFLTDSGTGQAGYPI